MLYKCKITGKLFTKNEMLFRLKNLFEGEAPKNPQEWFKYYEEVKATLKDMFVAKAEELGWSVEIGVEEIPGYENQRYAEFSQYTPAGEDFDFIVNFSDIEEIPKEVRKYYDSFDIDEHIEMWIEAKRNGVSGVPSTRALVNDAEDLDEMLKELSDELYGVSNGWDDELEDAE